eukprot:scaffold6507_cov90-Cylindrotheca_fusiformis.AAC.2
MCGLPPIACGKHTSYSECWAKLYNRLWEHSCEEKKHLPFHSLLEWKPNPHLTDWSLRMQIQTQLSSAFSAAGGIQQEFVISISTKRNDQGALKIRLATIFGIAIGLCNDEVRRLKNRKIVNDCKKNRDSHVIVQINKAVEDFVVYTHIPSVCTSFTCNTAETVKTVWPVHQSTEVETAWQLSMYR